MTTRSNQPGALHYRWARYRARHHLYQAWLAWIQEDSDDSEARYHRAYRHLRQLEDSRP